MPARILSAAMFLCSLPTLWAAVDTQFQLRRHAIEIPELGFVDGFQLLTTSSRFEFVKPKDFIVRVNSKSRQIRFSSSDGRCRIELLLSTNFTGRLPAQNLLRSFTTNSVPLLRDARLTGERHVYTGAGKGQAFDFVRESKGVPVAIRRIYVPSPDWCIVFTISTVAADRAKYRYVTGDFLSSFLHESRNPSERNSQN